MHCDTCLRPLHDRTRLDSRPSVPMERRPTHKWGPITRGMSVSTRGGSGGSPGPAEPGDLTGKCLCLPQDAPQAQMKLGAQSHGALTSIPDPSEAPPI